MRVEDLTKFEGECPNIVVFGISIQKDLKDGERVRKKEKE